MIRRLLVLVCALTAAQAGAGLKEDYYEAREAFRARDLNRLHEAVKPLDGTPLAIYGRYWPLALQMNTIEDAPVRSFLNDYPSDWLSDTLRLAYAKRLAKEQRWPEFRREAALVVEGDDDFNCYRLRQRLVLNDKAALKQAHALWFTGKPLPESCNPVFDALFARQMLTRENVWRRIHLALENNQFGLAQYLNRIFPAGQGFEVRMMNDSLNRPAALVERLTGKIEDRGEQEMAVASISRLARTNTGGAVGALQAIAPELTDRQKAYAWGRVGFHAARRHDPSALTWFAQADVAHLTDEEREWYVRAALRGYKWDVVGNVIRSMSPEKQADPAWRYWLGRAHKVQGRAVEANKQFAALSLEHHFYGLLAREELDSVADSVSGRFQASDADVERIAKQPAVQRALSLFHIDARGEAVREWNWSARLLDDRQLIAAAELARREGWYDRAIFSADRTRFVHDFSLRYLTPYKDVTRAYAAQVNLEEAWVYGLIRQESRFVTHARSGVGASGLMQLMPATASWVARKLGLRDYRPSTVNEIGMNVQLGTYYLRTVLDQLGNQPILATAAYNAGPGRARAWQASAPLEGAIYAETIPFSETRDYVKKVMANAQYYALGFGQNKQTFKQRLGMIPAKP